ncbi:MAG: L-aspartate oxidase [Cyclobacteriaceae bacterium]
MDHLYSSDFLVIGSGIAGLSFALKVAEHGKVNIVTKDLKVESNTFYAQGGVASVIAPQDSFSKHIEDTHIAGAGLCHNDAVEVLVNEGPAKIQELLEWGVKFSRSTGNPSEFDLAKEGGHSEHRILHAHDLTGAELQKVLIEQIKRHQNIHVFENHMAVELITEHHVLGNLQAAFNICFGAYVLNESLGKVQAFRANYTMLSTGGASKVYQHSTNPEIATGDGLAMAHRAGVRIANMEFVQFHPTSLYHPGHRSFLISEALRGHGGKLINEAGERFMPKYDARAELAPRDIVARSIDAEMKKRREECVYLDMTHLPPEETKERYPNIYKYCLDNLNLDISKSPIPVVPAAHYICGGIMTSLNGQTSMQCLFASGEVAHTGVHGANRLASNSLLEGLVFSHRAAMKVIGKVPRNFQQVIIPPWDDSGVQNEYEWRLIKHNLKEIRSIMWNYVGIVRSTEQLNRANRRLWVIFEEVENYYRKSAITRELLELRNLSATAYLIVRSAIRRQESRGAHYMVDFPASSDKYLKDTII